MEPRRSDTKARHDRAIGCEHRGSYGFRRVEPGRGSLGHPDSLEREPKGSRRGTEVRRGGGAVLDMDGHRDHRPVHRQLDGAASIGNGVRPHACLGPHRSEVKVERRPARRRRERRVSEIAVDREPSLRSVAMVGLRRRAIRAGDRICPGRPGTASSNQDAPAEFREPPMTGRSHRPGPGAGARLPPNRPRSE